MRSVLLLSKMCTCHCSALAPHIPNLVRSMLVLFVDLFSSLFFSLGKVRQVVASGILFPVSWNECKARSRYLHPVGRSLRIRCELPMLPSAFPYHSLGFSCDA